ncbi:MAG: hypothetical protein WCX65_10815 [bacterium]
MTATNETNQGRSNGLLIFLTLMIFYAFFTNTYLTTNDASRFSMTVSLATGGGGEITNILPQVISKGWKIKDFAVHDGKIYSDKAPLGSLIAVPVFLAATALGFKPPWVIYFVSLLTSGMMAAGTALLIYRLIPIWKRDERLRIVLALAYGIGGMSLFYGTVFFSSAMTAFCGFSAFYCFAVSPLSKRPAALAAIGGFLAGAAILSDYYAAITAVCVLGYGILANQKMIIPMILGFAVPIAILFYYNELVFGAPWPLSYKYASLYGSYHATGFYGVNLPGKDSAARLASILLAKWGFFFTNLSVIFSIYAFRKFLALRRESCMIVLMSAGYLLLNSSLSWFDAYSARFFMPLMPFLILPLAFLDFGNRWVRNAFFFAMGFSILINLVGADYFLPEFVGEQKPGMQNLAAIILAPHGIRIGYWNFVFPAILVGLVWLTGFRKRKQLKFQSNDISAMTN